MTMKFASLYRLARAFVFATPLACHPQGQPGGSTADDPSTSGPVSFGDLPPPDEPTTSGSTAGPDASTSDSSSTGLASTGLASTGPSSFCGDGVLDEDLGEQCDDGQNNSDTGACTHQCLPASCGDGKIWAGVEECDLGDANSADYAGCSTQCTRNPRCGDGAIDAEYGEQCDSAELNGSGDALEGEAPCTASCLWHSRTVFLSSVTYTGNLGGVSGADLKCQALAQAAGLANAKKYRAWISNGVQSPSTRFTQIDLEDLPYALRNGRLVASTFAELVEDGPRTGIWITELGTPLFEALVWTNTAADGEPFSATNHCNEWVSNQPMAYARVGLNALEIEQGPGWDVWRSERHWTSYISRSCTLNAHLYCFEDGQDGGAL